MEYLNRKEALLDAIAENGQTPEPMTREEALLKKIAEKACECLPTVDTEDNGKVLKVVEGVWTKDDAPTELPNVTEDDNGDVLKVVEGAWTKGEIPTPEPELPEVTSADNGKVLGVVNGEWEATTPPSSGLEVKTFGLSATTDGHGFLNIASKTTDKTMILGVSVYYESSFNPIKAEVITELVSSKYQPTRIKFTEINTTTGAEIEIDCQTVGCYVAYVELP